MKKISPLFFTATIIAAALSFSGCMTSSIKTLSSGILQTVFDASLPPDFVGDAAFKHDNAYLHLDVRAGNVRKVNGAWSWDWLVYRRNGISQGTIIIGNPPPLPPTL